MATPIGSSLSQRGVPGPQILPHPWPAREAPTPHGLLQRMYNNQSINEV
jgi:hypothetical protein